MIRLVVFAGILLVSGAVPGAEPFLTPFDSLPKAEADSVLTLDDVLSLVASHNPTLSELDFVRQAAEGDLVQAGVRPLPELEVEVEEIGLDAPGFSNAEIAVAVSQPLELFGQRRARINLAEAGRKAVRLESSIAAFDLYLNVRQAFLAVAHANEAVRLHESSVTLSQQTLETIDFRMEKGAALQAELLLARLDLQRSLLSLAEAEQALSTAKTELGSFWGDSGERIQIDAEDWGAGGDFVTQIERSGQEPDSSRGLLMLEREMAVAEAEGQLAAAEGRPELTLTAGVKRLQADGSNSFLFGVALPLPFWHSNKGAIKSSEARLQALRHRAERERFTTDAEMRAALGELKRMNDRLHMMDDQLLHTAEETFAALSEAHAAGRVPYVSLLEAERALIELQLERNDVVLAIHETIVSLERMTGRKLDGKGKGE